MLRGLNRFIPRPCRPCWTSYTATLCNSRQMARSQVMRKVRNELQIGVLVLSCVATFVFPAHAQSSSEPLWAATRHDETLLAFDSVIISASGLIVNGEENTPHYAEGENRIVELRSESVVFHPPSIASGVWIGLYSMLERLLDGVREGRMVALFKREVLGTEYVISTHNWRSNNAYHARSGRYLSVCYFVHGERESGMAFVGIRACYTRGWDWATYVETLLWSQIDQPEFLMAAHARHVKVYLFRNHFGRPRICASQDQMGLERRDFIPRFVHDFGALGRNHLFVAVGFQVPVPPTLEVAACTQGICCYRSVFRFFQSHLCVDRGLEWPAADGGWCQSSLAVCDTHPTRCR
jgi:hypothetical protein